jgi:hypothetical protein
MTDQDDLMLARRVRPMQIVTFAQMLGLGAFLGYAIYAVAENGGQGLNPPPGPPLLTYLSVGMLAVNLLLGMILPSIILPGAIRRIAAGTRQPPNANPDLDAGDTVKLLVLRQTTLFINLALLEGAGLFGGIAYLLEAEGLALGVPVAALVVQALNFPTQQRVRRWLENQTERLNQARQGL